MIQYCTDCDEPFLTEADSYYVKVSNTGTRLICYSCSMGSSLESIRQSDIKIKKLEAENAELREKIKYLETKIEHIMLNER